jgi:hypothetical protein
MHWLLIVALAVASVAVVASVTFSILEISRKLKRAKEQRTVLERLRAQQERKHLERVRAYLDLGADPEAHAAALQHLVESYYPPGYFPVPEDHRQQSAA